MAAVIKVLLWEIISTRTCSDEFTYHKEYPFGIHFRSLAAKFSSGYMLSSFNCLVTNLSSSYEQFSLGGLASKVSSNYEQFFWRGLAIKLFSSYVRIS